MSDGSSSSDDYAVTAEFYDVWAHGHWDVLAPALRDALGTRIDPAHGPIVDLGAGTGWATLTIADAVPGAQIVAVEPSRAMRGVLLSRLMDRPELRARVTVTPCTLAQLRWPEKIGGFVAMAMLGHLAGAERRELWQRLATHLGPSAPAIIQLQPPDRPAKVPLVRHTVIEIGDHTYEGWSKAEPIGRRVLRWSLRYVVRHGDDVIDDRNWTSDFRTVSVDDVRTEAAAAGLSTTCGPAGLLVLRRRC